VERKHFIIAAVIFSIALGTSFAQIFKWVDENGVAHYSDAPTSDDLTDDATSDEVAEAALPAETPTPAPTDTPPTPAPQPDERGKLMESISKMLAESPPAAAQQLPKVELFVTSWCGYCKQAEKFFRSAGVAYTAYDIEKDPKARQRMRQLTDYQGVPFAVVNGRQIKGYSEQAYRQALASR